MAVADKQAVDMEKLRNLVLPVRAGILESPLAKIQPAESQGWMQHSSLFDKVKQEDKDRLLELPEQDNREGLLFRRCVGSMLGMTVTDALGSNFEFLSVRDWSPDKKPTASNEPYFEYPKGEHGGVFHNPFNTFGLKPGQWTDDASMGFCLADSLLSRQEYDGTNIRVWFWNWWSNGINNAFRYDKARHPMQKLYGTLSVGLGGNISKSLAEVRSFTRQGKPIPPQCTLKNEDAGNGSIMRLAPIPIRYHTSLAMAMDMAYESSFTTHPGPLAAEACSFLSFLIVRCLHRQGEEETLQASEFLDKVVQEYLNRTEGTDERAKLVMRRLLRSAEPDNSTERCWNWRSKDLGLMKTLRNRGPRYNGYPVSPGYFGSYSMDGLAMALHAFYHTSSLPEALVYIINMCGDADSTGSVCGQIAGAFYSSEAFDSAWLAQVREWDHRETELRAIMLFADGYLAEKK